MTENVAQAQALLYALRARTPLSEELLNTHAALSTPFHREILGDHWHTGFYEAEGALGPQDQLRMERLVASSAGIVEESLVLDAGCGVGGPACHLARLTGARIRGLTPDARQLEIARMTAQRSGVAGRVSFDLGDAGSLPYQDGVFDAVLFFESPCRFPDRQRFFEEALRVLKPGGVLAGEDWLASDRCSAALRDPWSARICAAWALPGLGTVPGYAAEMAQAGFDVDLARDMRDEMALLRGFLARPAERKEVRAEMHRTGEPVRRFIMEGLLVLGEAAQCGAFTVGRFVARKPPLA